VTVVLPQHLLPFARKDGKEGDESDEEGRQARRCGPQEGNEGDEGKEGIEVSASATGVIVRYSEIDQQANIVRDTICL